MTAESPRGHREVIQDIPMEVRPVVVEWLRSHSIAADATASKIASANRHAKDSTTTVMVTYWRNTASAARYLAEIMAASSPIPDRAIGGKKDVTR